LTLPSTQYRTPSHRLSPGWVRIEERKKVDNIPSWQLTVSAIGVLASLIGGGLSGAIVNSIITKRRQKLDLSLKITDYFFSIYTETGFVLNLFIENDPLTNRNIKDRVLKIGDWYELVLTLCRKEAADYYLLGEIGILGQIDRFKRQVEAFRLKSNVLDAAWAAWPNIQAFSIGTGTPRMSAPRRGLLRRLMGG
jgi:hypothetical protein